MKKVWTEYMHDFLAFSYNIDFNVTSENYVDSILSFDRCFWHLGFLYKIYNIFPFRERNLTAHDMSSLLDRYVSDRKISFHKENKSFLTLLDLDQWDYYVNYIESRIKHKRKSIISLEILEEKNDGSLEAYLDSRLPHKEILDIENFGGNAFKDMTLDNEFYWEQKVGMQLSSNSNIWYDEIGITILEGDVYPTLVKPPKDNRATAYRTTPRFNSFLRDLKKKVIELGGEVKLDDYNKKYITEDGILLDGKIIFQEDIDSGKIKLPDQA